MTIIDYIELTWETLTPFAIADPHDHALLDRPIVVDARGAPEVPASGLIGSLREHLGESGAGVLGVLKDGATTPSRLRALGTELELRDATVSVRGQTKIDRCRGAAEGGSLRTSEMVNPGAQLKLWCEYDGAAPEWLVNALTTWEPTLGGGVGGGMGQTRLEECKTGSLDLAKAKDLERYLRGVSPSSFASLVEPVQIAPPAEQVLFRARAQIVDGLFIGGAHPTTGENGERNATPTYVRNGEEIPSIEGSSIRGVLRASVARIASTVLNIENIKNGRGTEEVVEGGNRVAEALFGSTNHRGMIAISGSFITDPTDGDGKPGPPRTEKRMHVGIDRFTGGAKPNLLFGESVIVSGSFELAIHPLNGGIPRWAAALILASIRDIDDGLVGFGAATSRGFGTIQFDKIEFDADFEPPLTFAEALPLDASTLASIVDLANAPALEAPRANAVVTDEPNEGERSQSEGPDDVGHTPVRTRVETQLIEVGRLDWESLIEYCRGLTAYWHDLDGAHIGALSVNCKAVESHLWAWTADGSRLIRARVDGHRCYVAELAFGSVAASKVSATVDWGLPWLPDSEQLPQRGRDTIVTVLNGQPIWLVTTAEIAPLTFIKIGGNRPSDVCD